MNSTFFQIGLGHFVLISFLVLAAGIATMLTKRNAIGILIGVELVLNAAAVNFVAFNHYVWGGADGHGIGGLVFAMFIIVLAAAEAAIALAIILNFYNNFSSVDVERADQMKG
ncbi:MAG: NADH-quinone oxidoreductase subunit NuoK [Planctomycetes bacterium]|nr:NADH-quinone oxidoreductase subunit NuoK [Planctomycetota bacterium]